MTILFGTVLSELFTSCKATMLFKPNYIRHLCLNKLDDHILKPSTHTIRTKPTLREGDDGRFMGEGWHLTSFSVDTVSRQTRFLVSS